MKYDKTISIYKNCITVWLLVPVAGHNICQLIRPNVNVLQSS